MVAAFIHRGGLWLSVRQPFPSGTSQEPQYHIESINYTRFACGSSVSCILAPCRVHRGGRAKSHFNELSRQDPSHNKNISIQTVSYRYHTISPARTGSKDKKWTFSCLKQYNTKTWSLVAWGKWCFKDVVRFVGGVCGNSVRWAENYRAGLFCDLGFSTISLKSVKSPLLLEII